MNDIGWPELKKKIEKEKFQEKREMVPKEEEKYVDQWLGSLFEF